MRACIQRVSQARVTVAGDCCAEIGLGLLVLLGVAQEDVGADAQVLADKIVGLRVFDDAAGKMNLALADNGPAPHLIICGTLYFCGEVLAASPETWPR